MAADEDPTRVFDAELVVLEKSRLRHWGSFAAMAFGAGMLTTSFMLHAAPAIILSLYVGLFGWIVQSRFNGNVRKRERRVHVTPEGVAVARGRSIAREAIADGFFQPRSRTKPNAPGSSVRLVDKRRRVLFEAEASEGEAQELLQVLGLDVGSKRAEFKGASPLYATFGRNLLFTLATFAAFGPLFLLLHASPPLLFLFWATVVAAGALGSRITVGVDGVLVRWLWTERFFPMSEIERVTTSGDNAIAIRLRSGKIELVYTSNSRGATSGHTTQHRDSVRARILEALAAHRGRGKVADVALLVGRGTRTSAEWKRALDELKADARGYRLSAVRDDDLWCVVEDPGAPEDARAAAAVLLRRSLDDAGRARVRVVAETTASPRLRVALDAATGESEAAVEEALGALAADERAFARRTAS